MRTLTARVLRQTGRDLWAGQVMEWAAALACYLVLSLVPLLLAGAALASYLVEGFLPAGVLDLDPLVAGAIAARGRVGLVGIGLWLVAGRRILGALVTALDRVSDVDARHETVQRRALVELVALTGIGALFIVALLARTLVRVLWEAIWGPHAATPVTWLLGTAIHALILVAAFFALYTIVPLGKRNGRAACIGASVATALLLVVRALFVAGLDRLWVSFRLVYGPLALAAVLLSWGWLFGMIVLIGGSLASHIKVMMIEGQSAREAERRHVARKRAKLTIEGP